MAIERDPYRVLGVPSSASQDEITGAYRQLLRDHHPDTRITDGSAEALEDRTLQQILDAYALLRDPELRAAHDRAVTASRQKGEMRPPRAPGNSSPVGHETPRRIHVAVVGDAPPRRIHPVSLWVGPVRRHR